MYLSGYSGASSFSLVGGLHMRARWTPSAEGGHTPSFLHLDLFPFPKEGRARCWSVEAGGSQGYATHFKLEQQDKEDISG